MLLYRHNHLPIQSSPVCASKWLHFLHHHTGGLCWFTSILWLLTELIICCLHAIFQQTWHFEIHFFLSRPSAGGNISKLSPIQILPSSAIAMLLAWFLSPAFPFRALMKMLNSKEVLKSHCDFKRRALTKKADLVKLQALTNRWSVLNVSIKCTPVLWLPHYLQSLQLCPGTAARLACEPCQFVISAGLKSLSPVGAAFFADFKLPGDWEFFLTLSLFPPREGADGFMVHLVPFCTILDNATSPAQVARN